MNQPPQYNPNPNVPVGQSGNMYQQPQQAQQRHPQNYIFFQPRCNDSNDFFKLLQFSQVLNSQFKRIDITVPGQKIPPNLQSTPSIAIYPDYKIKNTDDSFRWLQEAIIHEQRQRNSANQQQMQHLGGGGNGGFPCTTEYESFRKYGTRKHACI